MPDWFGRSLNKGGARMKSPGRSIAAAELFAQGNHLRELAEWFGLLIKQVTRNLRHVTHAP